MSDSLVRVPTSSLPLRFPKLTRLLQRLSREISLHPMLLQENAVERSPSWRYASFFFRSWFASDNALSSLLPLCMASQPDPSSPSSPIREDAPRESEVSFIRLQFGSFKSSDLSVSLALSATGQLSSALNSTPNCSQGLGRAYPLRGQSSCSA